MKSKKQAGGFVFFESDIPHGNGHNFRLLILDMPLERRDVSYSATNSVVIPKWKVNLKLIINDVIFYYLLGFFHKWRNADVSIGAFLVVGQSTAFV